VFLVAVVINLVQFAAIEHLAADWANHDVFIGTVRSDALTKLLYGRRSVQVVDAPQDGGNSFQPLFASGDAIPFHADSSTRRRFKFPGSERRSRRAFVTVVTAANVGAGYARCEGS
jgi:hypothetical protein